MWATSEFAFSSGYPGHRERNNVFHVHDQANVFRINAQSVIGRDAKNTGRWLRRWALSPLRLEYQQSRWQFGQGGAGAGGYPPPHPIIFAARPLSETMESMTSAQPIEANHSRQLIAVPKRVSVQLTV